MQQHVTNDEDAFFRELRVFRERSSRRLRAFGREHYVHSVGSTVYSWLGAQRALGCRSFAIEQPFLSIRLLALRRWIYNACSRQDWWFHHTAANGFVFQNWLVVGVIKRRPLSNM